MQWAVRVLALATRLGFFALATKGLVALIRGSYEAESVHATIMAALFSLFASCALSDPSLMRTGLLAVAMVALMACDILFARKAAAGSELFLPVALLAGTGVVVGFDTMGVQVTRHVVRVAVFCAICAATFALTRCHTHRLAASFKLFLALTVVLCALPLVPGLGVTTNGSTAWVGFGGRGLLQPSELAKVTLALSLAGYLAANVDRLSSFSLRGILPLLGVFVLALGLEWMVRDIGTAMVLFVGVAAMVATSSRRAGAVYALIAAVGVGIMLVFAYRNFGHVAQRFDAWLTPAGTYGGEHLLAMARAMGNGGLIGTGLGMGHAYTSVFARDTDAVYAVIVEELGLAGALQVLLAVVALVVMAARVASRLPRESFERNLIAASVTLVCVQAFVIVGGVTRVIPLTGVTLPFVSRGGSSLLASFVLVGMVGAAASSHKSGEPVSSVSAHVVAACCTVGMAACLVMTAKVVVGTGGLRLCGLTSHYEMGTVRSADGVVLARGRIENNQVSYRFPEDRLAAHVLGAYSDGLTARLQSDAYVSAAVSPLRNLLGLPEVVGQETLTLDTRIQRVAEEQLADLPGAIVVLDAKTGAILAEASGPSYDPNEPLLDEDDPQVSAFNRAIKSAYPPGSTFKLVTAAAALDGGYATPQTSLEGNTLTLSSGEKIRNLGGDFGTISLAQALEWSSNTAFAQLALQMGNETLERQAEAFGFNQQPADDLLHAAVSTYGSASTEYGLAWAAVGQPTAEQGTAVGPRVTVLQMAEVMAAVANDGLRVQPYLLASKPPKQGFFGGERAMSSQGAQELWEMLVGSSHVRGARVAVAGKTGTAETDSANVCWYVGAADGCVVACCLEGSSGLGSTVALPRALAVLDAAVDLGAYQIVS